MSPRESERFALATVGVVALVGLGWLVWQQSPPLRVVGGPATTAGPTWDRVLERARRVDVNAAGVAELERLPHVGPSLARRIVEHREAHGGFRSPEELSRVRGIGPKTYEQIKHYVTTE
jgi:competence protein ComEA